MCVCENSKYLKSIVDDLVILFHKIIIVLKTLSTNDKIVIFANIRSTVSTNSCRKNVTYKMNGYVLYTFLLHVFINFYYVSYYYS